MIHRPASSLLTGPIRILVVGCGGTGSAVASGLPYLHHALIARGHPHGLHVTLQDGDEVSPTNTVRQPFARCEIGQNKATVLATRLNCFWGLRWQAVPRNLTARDESGLNEVDVVVGCVDTRRARRVIDEYCGRLSSRVRYWLDFGNNSDSGQFVLGQPYNAVNNHKRERLPTAPELWPEIADTGIPEQNLPSCSAEEALTRQHPFMNQALAQLGLSMLTRLFAGGIEFHGGFLNLATGRMSPIRVPEAKTAADIIKEAEGAKRPAPGTGTGARARRRRKRAGAQAGAS